MKKLSLAALALGFSILASGCIGQPKEETTMPAAVDSASGIQPAGDAKKVASDSAEGMKVNAEAEKMAADGGNLPQMAETRRITLDSFKFGYSEEMIEVKAGETIELTLTNSDGMHDFRIDELNVKTKTINKGETDTVTFTIPMDAKGKSFEYYCGIMNHRQMGQVGKLVIK